MIKYSRIHPSSSVPVVSASLCSTSKFSLPFPFFNPNLPQILLPSFGVPGSLAFHSPDGSIGLLVTLSDFPVISSRKSSRLPSRSPEELARLLLPFLPKIPESFGRRDGRLNLLELPFRRSCRREDFSGADDAEVDSAGSDGVLEMGSRLS